MFNVNREINDTFYRYKMPKLSCKVEGKGNGIKTVIVNMKEVAEAIYRRPNYVTKYFGSELGTQTLIDEKTPRYVVNGAHDANKLQDILDGFIKKFVLCSNCANPETSLTVKKKTGLVHYKCKACGHSDLLDPKHKLTTYISKNPPTSVDAAPETTNGDEKKENGDNMFLDKDKSPIDSDSDEEDWETNKKQLNSMAKSTKKPLMPVIEKTANEKVDEFYQLVKEVYRLGNIDKNYKKIYQSCDELKLGSGSVMVLVEVFLSKPETIIEDIDKYRNAFLLFTRINGTEQDQLKSQKSILSAMELTIDRFHKELLPLSCNILKKFYDADIVTEDVILDWYSAPISKKKKLNQKVSELIRTKCEPMITWLREAEEDDSDDKEDNDETENNNVENKMESLNIKAKAWEEIPDDEIDIDDI